MSLKYFITSIILLLAGIVINSLTNIMYLSTIFYAGAIVTLIIYLFADRGSENFDESHNYLHLKASQLSLILIIVMLVSLLIYYSITSNEIHWEIIAITVATVLGKITLLTYYRFKVNRSKK